VTAAQTELEDQKCLIPEFAEEHRVDSGEIMPSLTFVTAMPSHDTAHHRRSKYVDTAKLVQKGFHRLPGGKALNLWSTLDKDRGG
jgi:hypothetical protein